jgi:integrase
MAPRTVQKRVYLLSSSLKGAVDLGVLDYNPAARINVVKGVVDKRRYLSAAESDRLLAQFQPPFANPLNEVIVSTLLWTGMRWGEMAGLQVERVLFDRGLINVQEVWDNDMRRLKAYPKGRKQRFVPIAGWLVPMLKYAIGRRTTGHVFLVGDRHVLEYSNWRQKFWKGACDRSGLTGVRIHDLRHTYASTMLQAGVPLEEVGKLLGHVSMQTTMIYAHLSEAPDERVLAVLAGAGRGANVGQGVTVHGGTKLQDSQPDS